MIANAQCGVERPVIGYETREELACEPAKFFAKVIMREKRGSHCHAEKAWRRPRCPPQIVPKSKLSNGFIIELVVKNIKTPADLSPVSGVGGEPGH